VLLLLPLAMLQWHPQLRIWCQLLMHDATTPQQNHHNPTRFLLPLLLCVLLTASRSCPQYDQTTGCPLLLLPLLSMLQWRPAAAHLALTSHG
jgi:hypothetical protein